MKKSFIFAGLVFSTVIFNACSSESGNSSQNVVVDKVSGNRNVANANVIQNNNVAVPINTANATNANTIQTNVDANTVQSNDMINRRNPKLNNSVSGEKPKIQFQPGPNNSEIGSTMGKNGEFIQLRVFKSDPQIKSLERIVSTEDVKIFLKNGKVVNAKIDKNFDVVNSSPQDILIAAGLLNKPDASQTGGK